jgi:hypothetical protein
MNLIGRGLFVLGGIAIGSFLINHFVFGNTGDALPKSERMGEWRKAAVREACFPATESPEKDSLAPRMPAGAHRVSPQDFRRAREMTVALNCYLVTKANAVCDPDNRAWIVDYVGKYYGKKDEMLSTAMSYGEGEIRNVEQVWNSPRNRAIEAALAEHVKDGHLARRDFGWSAPAAIRPLLDRYADAADQCPRAPHAAGG